MAGVDEWADIKKRLDNPALSAEQRKRIVEEAVKQTAKLTQPTLLLPHCTSDQAKQVIDGLTRKRQWEQLRLCLAHDVVSGEQRRYILTQVIRHSDEGTLLESFLSHCDADHTAALTERFVKGQCWSKLGEWLQRDDLSPHQRLHLLRRALTRIDDDALVEYLLPDCCVAEVDLLIDWLLKQRCWWGLGCCLQRSDLCLEQREHIVDESVIHADKRNLIKYIFPFSTSNEVRRAVGRFRKARCWWGISHCLKLLQLSADELDPILTEAIELADKQNFNNLIFPHCTGRQTTPLTQRFVKEQGWKSLGQWLERSDLSSDQRQYIVQQATARADEANFLKWILPSCDGEHTEQLTAWFIKKWLWQELGDWLKREDLGTDQRRHVLETAVEHADEETFTFTMLPRCSGADLPYILVPLVKRRWIRGLCVMMEYSRRLGSSQIIDWSDLKTRFEKRDRQASYRKVSAVAAAVAHKQPAFLAMLYECGFCTHSEMHFVYRHYTTTFRSSDRQNLVLFLEKASKTTRSLKSLCRVAILQGVSGSGQYRKHVQGLSLPESLKKFVQFSEFLDPAFTGKHCFE